MPKVFDRFYRADPARTQETEGYGLGLSIAKTTSTPHNLNKLSKGRLYTNLQSAFFIFQSLMETTEDNNF